MPVKIQLRRDTAADWTSENPILRIGEIGLELGTPPLLKIGDGVHAWRDLDYWYGAVNSTVLADILNDLVEKTTPVDDDAFAALDSENGNILARILYSSLKTALKDYFDGLYMDINDTVTPEELAPVLESVAAKDTAVDTDAFVVLDSESGDVLARVLLSTLKTVLKDYFDPFYLNAPGNVVLDEIDSVAHGFAVGDVLGQDESAWVKVDADSETDTEALGIVQSVTDDAFEIVYAGKIVLASGVWPESASAGDVLYLSADTAGLLTLTEPASPDTSRPMVVCLSTTTGIVVQYRPAVQGDVSSSAVVLSATDRVLGRQSPGGGAGEEIPCTAAGRALIAGETATAQRTTLSAVSTSDSRLTDDRAPTAVGMAAKTHAADTKATLADNDEVALVDSEATYSWARVLWSTIKALFTQISIGSTLPTSNNGNWRVCVLTAADNTAKCGPGLYWHNGTGWMCLACCAAYALGNLGATPALSVIPGCIYTATQDQIITASTVTFSMPGVVSITKSGAFAFAQPTMAGRTSKQLKTGAWTDAATALCLVVVSDDGTYLVSSATALAAP